MMSLEAISNTRSKTVFHVIQLILVVVVIAVSSARVFMKNQPRTRANTIALSMASKSLIILQYQLLTEHVARFKKWASLKAFAILNGLEILFWAAVVFLMIQVNIASCHGTSCILSWIACGLAVILTLLAVVVFGISYIQFRNSRKFARHAKAAGHYLGTSHGKPSGSDGTVRTMIESA